MLLSFKSRFLKFVSILFQLAKGVFFTIKSFSIKGTLYSAKEFSKKYSIALLLILIATLISLRNYDPGTYLTGWDTLHPEFNLKEYWGRIIDGVWQEHQALGSVATQAHASEIPRILIMSFFSLFMAVHQMRYVYAFLMLVLGPFGVYCFLKYAVLKNLSFRSRELGAFAGGMLYLLNLGTLQHFYVPLEMFLTHYGFLGFVFLFGSKYYEEGKRSDLFYFLIFSFFIASQAHTATLFYAFMVNFLMYFGLLVFQDLLRALWQKNISIFFTGWNKAFLLVIYTLLINAFWLFPNIYFIVKHSAEIKESKIHHLFSEEAFLQNKEFGRIEDVSILRNFLFNWGEHVGNNEFGRLLDEWSSHLNRPGVMLIGYITFGLMCLGIVSSVLRRERYMLPLAGVLIVSMFFLFNVNPPLGFLFIYLQNTFEIFKEAFRFPFTKFSITAMFAYASFFGIFFAHLGFLIQRIFKKTFAVYPVYIILYSIIVFSLFYYMRPAINGYMVSPSMRVKIPDRYFQMFSYLEQQKEYGRVADLPIHSFWGWMYYNWDSRTKLGYQGAGFLWFGIKQPLMDREFDRWNLLNEQYYREMSTAVYSEDLAFFEQTLEKYKIRWIFLDESVLAPGSDPTILYFTEIKALLEKSERIEMEKNFGEGLVLYKYTPKRDFALYEVLDNFAYTGDSVFKEYTDPMYEIYGDYVKKDSNRYFPYVGITHFDESILPQYVSSDESNTYFTNRLAFSKIAIEEVTDLFQYKVLLKRTNEGIGMQLSDVPGFVGSADFEAVLPDKDLADRFVLNINNNLFSINTSELTEEYATQGFVVINPSESVNVVLHSPQDISLVQLDYSSLLERCGDIGSGSTYSIEFVETGFKIFAKDIKTCLTVKLRDLIGETDTLPSYIQLSTVVEEFGAKAGICILDSATGLCVNKPMSAGRTSAFIDPQRFDNYFLRFNVSGILKSTEVGAGFTNLSVSSLEPVYAETFDISLNTKVSGEYFGRLVFKKDLDYSGNVASLNYNPRICQTGYRNFDKSSVDVGEKGILYTSRGDSLCDSFQFPFAVHSTGYILEVKAKNVEGMPLRVCLTNESSKRCDLYVSLGESKEFKTHYFLIPPMGDGSGYTVNFSNTVFGEGVSINELEYISLTPFPYSLLRNLHEKVPTAHGEKLLVYNQAYEPGWTAFCGITPCKAQHSMGNNWSNGWIFEDGAVPANVRVVFLPQLLEYLGFVLTVGAFLLVKRVH
ncbi:hypothetical protein A2619_01435 [candidate division WWE3 bacterium RIFOXYD1_FULL_39_9]|uniref:Membrane protein 6-pyruvoyl-tetrahydropterin synthase-related domain-containing protein n=1 Tax=candidate division WWE3 bacterium RIFOXYD1_FULL_39_9 TaxID=1802649 RepID=A0A1F4X5U7_UNCKA|nr:MAG: hypothetical protein A2619_01435 [candidate division WWE3 bacterium RIFOXYD1_FULL_39_9]